MRGDEELRSPGSTIASSIRAYRCVPPHPGGSVSQSSAPYDDFRPDNTIAGPTPVALKLPVSNCTQFPRPIVFVQLVLDRRARVTARIFMR
jgi:hypothetical protein